jgi:hypothetical protein
MRAAGLRVTRGDLRCLAAGHVARLAINRLVTDWTRSKALGKRMAVAKAALEAITSSFDLDALITALIQIEPSRGGKTNQVAWLPGF